MKYNLNFYILKTKWTNSTVQHSTTHTDLSQRNRIDSTHQRYETVLNRLYFTTLKIRSMITLMPRTWPRELLMRSKHQLRDSAYHHIKLWYRQLLDKFRAKESELQANASGTKKMIIMLHLLIPIIHFSALVLCSVFTTSDQ